MLGSNCDLKTHVQNLAHPPTNRGHKYHLFEPTSQLNGNFKGLYLRNKTRYRQQVKCIDNYKESHTSSQTVINFGPQTALNWTAIFPILCKFCFLRHCQASQTEISKQLNHTLPNGGWYIALTICCTTVGVVPRTKWGPRNFYISSVFRQLRHLMTNIFWMKRDMDNQARALESTKCLLHCPKMSWTLSTNGLKLDRTSYPPSLFCLSQSIAYPLIGINVRGVPQRL